jgi:hypothetical protein
MRLESAFEGDWCSTSKSGTETAMLRYRFSTAAHFAYSADF